MTELPLQVLAELVADLGPRWQACQDARVTVDDRIRSAATTIYQALIEAELTAVIGAAPHERTEARTAQRNGARPRTLTTTAGDLELRIPKLRAGSFFPRCWSAAGGSTRRCSPW